MQQKRTVKHKASSRFLLLRRATQVHTHCAGLFYIIWSIVLWYTMPHATCSSFLDVFERAARSAHAFIRSFCHGCTRLHSDRTQRNHLAHWESMIPHNSVGCSWCHSFVTCARGVAGTPQYLDKVLEATKTHQKSQLAEDCAIAFAIVVEKVVHGSSIRDAVRAATDEAPASTREAISAVLEHPCASREDVAKVRIATAMCCRAYPHHEPSVASFACNCNRSWASRCVL